MVGFETIETEKFLVACDGSDRMMGHPVVYLNLAPEGRVICPYCSREFVNRAAVEAMLHHPEPASGVVTPSASGPGATKEDESPPPRQSKL